MKRRFLKYFFSIACSASIVLGAFFSASVPVKGAQLSEIEAQVEARRALPIQSNEIKNWPEGPVISAEAAILMEANTGTVLYAKNIHDKMYPASTTKILTCLIAAERTNLSDIVTMSDEAVFSVPWDGSKIFLDVGEQLTVDQALQATLIASANDAANGLAELVGGSLDDFAKIMNERAKELGCTNSNFVNSNGLYDDNHYTTAYDLALIARAFFDNELLSKYSRTTKLHLKPSAYQPDEIIEFSKNKLYEGGEYYYEYLVGSKTGYTDIARQTLVSCAEKNGMKLICVVFKEETPTQFEDTVTLFDYGFGNFQTVNISENDSQYRIDNANFFDTNTAVFGSSNPIMTLNESDYIVIPNAADLSDTQSTISYDVNESNQIASIDYTYNGVSVGSVSVELSNVPTSTSLFSENRVALHASESENSFIFINVKYVIFSIVGIALIAIVIFILHDYISNYSFSKKKRRRFFTKKKRYGKYKDIDF